MKESEERVKPSRRKDRRRGKGRRPRGRPKEKESGDSGLRFTGLPPVSAMDDVTLGVANLTRKYVKSDALSLPTIIYLKTSPFEGFVGTFGATNNLETDRSGDTTDTSLGKDEVLYALSPQTKYFYEEVWSVINNLLQLGTGSRSPVSASAFVRYVSMWSVAYAAIYERLMINHITYHYDWTVVYPHSDVIPVSLYSRAETYLADDIEVIRTWRRRMKRLESLPMLPMIPLEIKRIMTPFLTATIHNRMMVPVMSTTNWSETGDFPLTPAMQPSEVDRLLQYIEVTLGAELSTLKSFLPFPAAMQGIWDVGPIGLDLNRDTGVYNSPVVSFTTTGDSNDPSPDDTLQYWVPGSSNPSGADEPTVINFLTRSVRPTFAEMRMSTIFKMNSNTVDDDYVLASFHKCDIRGFVDTVSEPEYPDNVLRIGGYSAATINVPYSRWQEFGHSRYAYRAALSSGDERRHGISQPGFNWAHVDAQSYEILLEQYLENLFSMAAIRIVNNEMQGGSIRTLRGELRMAIEKTSRY